MRRPAGRTARAAGGRPGSSSRARRLGRGRGPVSAGPAPSRRSAGLAGRRSPAPRASGAADSRDACSCPQARRGGGSGARARAAYVPAPPQARSRRARDNGVSAANTPRLSIRGCLLSSLARPGHCAQSLTVRSVGPACALRTAGAADAHREIGQRSRDTCGPGAGTHGESCALPGLASPGFGVASWEELHGRGSSWALQRTTAARRSPPRPPPPPHVASASLQR